MSRSPIADFLSYVSQAAEAARHIYDVPHVEALVAVMREPEE